jgi:DNA repair exonuclease SbcCD ATPase subunit
LLRDYAKQCREVAAEQQQERSNLLGLIARLKEFLRGKQVIIDRLEERIQILEADNAALVAEQQQSKANEQIQQELEALQLRYNEVEEHRQRLAKNNQSLGGRVAHTNRYKRKRDELAEALRQEREVTKSLKRQIEQLRAGEQLGLGLSE